MSVLINSMDIPKNCSDCPLNHDEMSCAITGTRWWSDTMILLDFDYTKERLYDCPLSEVPFAQPEPFVDADKLKRCRFEYINACKIVAHPTPDTSKSDIYDAHALIKALHPIFGDVEF